MARNTPMITRLNFENHGRFSKETLYSARVAKKDNYVPLKMNDAKMSDVTKYGGFTNVYGAYFFLVEHEEKGKKVKEVNGPNGIFDDKNYRDADYYKQYPTIFHLRKELMYLTERLILQC